MALYPTLPFLALRFGLATFVLLPLALLRLRRRSSAGLRHRALRGGGRRALRGGALMGLLLAAGYIFQTLGLERTSASNAGFITGLFVVLTPLLGALIFRAWPNKGAMAGVLLAFSGLFLLSGGAATLQGGAGVSPGGDFLVFLCAVSFAAHILATARYAEDEDPILLTAVQLGVVSLLTAALAGAAAAGGVDPPLSLPVDRQVLLALGVTALFASALGFYVQTYAQTHSPPTRTAVILTMEPVFAGLFAYLLSGERLGVAGWLGAGLILAGMLVSELLPGERGRLVAGEEGAAWVGEEEGAAP